jgi:hypothetical protein
MPAWAQSVLARTGSTRSRDGELAHVAERRRLDPAGRSGPCQRSISTAVTWKTVFLMSSGFTTVILAFTHGPSSTGTLMG